MAVLAISILMTEKTEEELEQIHWIQYPVSFKDQTKALLNSKIEVNAMIHAIAH